MPSGVTSFDNPTVGAGNVVNDVQRVFNDFNQISTEYQEHNGAVDTSTSPQVQYQYTDGSANTIRPTALIYPNGRVLNLNYGTSGGTDDALSRIVSLIDDDGVTHLVDYTRIGVDGIVEATYPQPNIRYDLINGSGADPYSGLDQFDRVIDCRWWNISTTTDVERVKHTYDRASNRLSRENTVAKAQSPAVNQDEFYTYNEMYELDRLDRGQLNAGKTAIQPGTLNFAQAWGLDATGNWSNFDQDTAGSGSFDLVQTRAHSVFNEIESITGGGWLQPAYDLAGNMVSMPQPSTPADGFGGVYDAWNRLVSLWSGGSPVGIYRFDGLNRRVSKIVSDVLRDIFYTSGWQAIEERVGGSTTPDRQFVWGLRYIDDLVARDRGTERLFGIQDPNWNMTAVADSTGAIRERYRYTAYGLPTVLTPTFTLRGASSFDWETRFAGYRWDVESWFLFARLRYLNPATGAWMGRDPRPADGTVSFYEYVRGRPNVLVDATGTQATRPVPCTQQDCDDCVKEGWTDRKDPTLAAIYMLLTEKRAIGVGRKWKKGCQPKIKCCPASSKKAPCDKCANKGEFGGLIKGTQDIFLCSVNFGNYTNVAGSAHGKCGQIWETLRHELIHLLDQCTGIDRNAGLDPCELCVCDEYRAYDLSGQCDDGSVWRQINPQYKDKQDCIEQSIIGSCDAPCGFINKTDKERLATVTAALANCTTYQLGAGGGGGKGGKSEIEQ